MTDVLAQISSIAVWGSLTASFVLGCSMLVQAALFHQYRIRFISLAVVSFAIVSTDLAHSALAAETYELLRVCIWALYGPVILFVFGTSVLICALLFLALLAAGFFSWVLIAPALATTTVLPITFIVAAVAHAKRYGEKFGFGSCILLSTSITQALACASYFWIMSLANPGITILGYAHYALISIAAVLFGWIHVPREMTLGVPVKVNATQGKLFIATFVASELFVMPPFLFNDTIGLISYGTFSFIQMGALLLLYFAHRYQLVIYTDNVAKLLEERTHSLKLAQQELAKQNDIQREKLTKQARELQQKAQVIERQSRLELAAQTAGQAAHDIQNLLSPFLIHLDRLSQASADTNRVVQIADILKSNAEDLLHLNSQLLALSRRGRIEKNRIEVSELIRSTLQQFPIVTNSISCEINEELSIAGSRAQLKRALTNIIMNAYESNTEGKTEVAISVRRITVQTGKACHLGFLATGSYVEIAIADNGSGIATLDLERIFEPFYSSKAANSRSGSGLGLSIVAGVIEDHSGVIDVVTGPEGSTFSIYFRPLGEPSLDNMTSNEILGSPLLVIKDHNTLFAPALQQLNELGAEIISTTTPVEALGALTTQPVSVIVFCQSEANDSFLDLFFKALHIQPTVKAVVISDSLSKINRYGFMQIGVEYFLELPLSGEKLYEAVAGSCGFDTIETQNSPA